MRPDPDGPVNIRLSLIIGPPCWWVPRLMVRVGKPGQYVRWGYAIAWTIFAITIEGVKNSREVVS